MEDDRGIELPGWLAAMADEPDFAESLELYRATLQYRCAELAKELDDLGKQIVEALKTHRAICAMAATMLGYGRLRARLYRWHDRLRPRLRR